MGGRDKAAVSLGGRPLLAHVLERLGAEAAPVAISANGDPARFAAYGCPILPDRIEGRAGPLAGIEAGLAWAAGLHPRPAWLAVAAVDVPLLPAGIVDRLREAAESEGATVACPSSGGRVHWAIGLWAPPLAAAVADALARDVRRVEDVARSRRIVIVDFPCPDGAPDPFANVNTCEDLAALERALTRC